MQAQLGITERSSADEDIHDKTVVLGLVTTKTGRQETVEELETRIHEAARHVPLERLALSRSADSPPPSSATGSPPPTSRPNSGQS
jgi:hypothetical protein